MGTRLKSPAMSYFNTFITVAPDCPIEQSQIPPSNRPKKPIHLLQYELLTEKPYHFTHKTLIFQVYLIREGLEDLSQDEKEIHWNQLFSKGHPCLRASALTKRYGFGAFYDEKGAIGLIPMESEDYQHFLNNEQVEKIPAMRSSRKKK